jgi:hypothetical protein
MFMLRCNPFSILQEIHCQIWGPVKNVVFYLFDIFLAKLGTSMSMGMNIYLPESFIEIGQEINGTANVQENMILHYKQVSKGNNLRGMK